MRKSIEEKYKGFVRQAWLFLIGGFLLFALGLIRFLFFTPGVGINLKTQQPMMLDGSILIIIGLGLFIIGLYRINNKQKAFRSKIEIEKELEEIEEQKHKKIRGY